MATYKVLQDIEAEDKLVGPLTFRQFVYAGLSALFLYLTFLVATKGLLPASVLFLPLGVICGVFAWPWSRDQPTEVWALAKIRFLIKPRRRVWDQSGIKELVTITVPKKVERALTNGLSETEVRSRLQALSSTIDSRGWAIKNTTYGPRGDSDRLVTASSLPQPVETIDVRPSDDMLDVKNNPVAAQFDTMIAASARAHRQEIIDKMQQTNTAQAATPTPVTAPVAPPSGPATPQPVASTGQAAGNNYWFLNQPTATTSTIPQDTVTFNTQVVAPGASVTDLPVTSAVPTADEESFIKQLKAEPAFSPNMHGHLHVIQPLSAQQAATTVAPPTPAPTQPPPAVPPVTQGPDPVTLDLVRNDDLDVATIAREAQRRKEPPQDEVVISLH